MLLAANLAPALLDTVLGRLALLFLAGAAGDVTAAREAATQMLAAYNIETPDELRLAAEVISFGFHALEALSQAAEPDLPLTKVLRLRGSAVSLSREGHKAQCKLDRIQRDRRTAIAPPQPAVQTQPVTPPTGPEIDRAMEIAREAIQSVTRKGSKNWTQSLQKRLAAQRITDSLKKNQIASARQPAMTSATSAALSPQPAD